MASRGHKRRGLNLVFGIIILLISFYFFLHASIFNIKTVNVAGNYYSSEQQILEVAAIETGQNIWQLNKAGVAEKVKMLPQIRSVEVSRKFPNGILIAVKERTSVAVVVSGTEIIKLDRFGINLGAGEINGLLPVITGVELDNSPAPGEPARGENLDLALEVAGNLSELEDSFVTEIDVAGSPQIKVYTLGGTEIRLGDHGNLANKLLMAQKVIAEWDSTRTIEYIDVSQRPVIKFKEFPKTVTN